MKPLGIVRNMDDLGRVVIPKEIRRSIGVKEGDEMEIFATNRGVYFQKYDPNDEATPDIFREMGCAAVPAQSPAKASSRKQVMVHDYGANEERYVSLTEDQIRFLDYIKVEWGFDLGYDIVDQFTFEEV